MSTLIQIISWRIGLRESLFQGRSYRPNTVTKSPRRWRNARTRSLSSIQDPADVEIQKYLSCWIFFLLPSFSRYIWLITSWDKSLVSFVFLHTLSHTHTCIWRGAGGRVQAASKQEGRTSDSPGALRSGDLLPSCQIPRSFLIFLTYSSINKLYNAL